MNLTPFITIGSLLAILLFPGPAVNAQAEDSVRWLSFEQLEDSLAVNPKAVFIDFYTEWCTYCRKMDRKVFTKAEVIDLLNERYYAVRFDAESDATVNFAGQVFVNDQTDKSRRPLHQIAQLLALRKGKFVAPTLLLLDKEFKVTARYFTYMDGKKLLRVLQ